MYTKISMNGVCIHNTLLETRRISTIIYQLKQRKSLKYTDYWVFGWRDTKYIGTQGNWHLGWHGSNRNDPTSVTRPKVAKACSHMSLSLPLSPTNAADVNEPKDYQLILLLKLIFLKTNKTDKIPTCCSILALSSSGSFFMASRAFVIPEISGYSSMSVVADSGRLIPGMDGTVPATDSVFSHSVSES